MSQQKIITAAPDATSELGEKAMQLWEALLLQIAGEGGPFYECENYWSAGEGARVCFFCGETESHGHSGDCIYVMANAYFGENAKRGAK